MPQGGGPRRTSRRASLPGRGPALPRGGSRCPPPPPAPGQSSDGRSRKAAGAAFVPPAHPTLGVAPLHSCGPLPQRRAARAHPPPPNGGSAVQLGGGRGGGREQGRARCPMPGGGAGWQATHSGPARWRGATEISYACETGGAPGLCGRKRVGLPSTSPPPACSSSPRPRAGGSRQLSRDWRGRRTAAHGHRPLSPTPPPPDAPPSARAAGGAPTATHEKRDRQGVLVAAAPHPSRRTHGRAQWHSSSDASAAAGAGGFFGCP